ncbi:MAG: cupin domain-containing protein [Rhodospirillaceae bacterium]
MARPHIEFIHAQNLDWQTGLLPAPFADIECKMLSQDDETGACSTILRYPKGWSASDTQHFNAGHEFLVLEGSMDLNDQHYPFDSYGYLPAGLTHENWKTDDGAVVLTFFSATLVSAPGPGNMTEDAIPYLYLHDMKWTSADVDPDLDFLRIAHKILRKDETLGETTMILNCGAQSHPTDWAEAALAHPCVEEMFLLSGDIIADRGIMNAGSYFWRPPHIWHGPFGSRNGNLCLIRFMEGKHVNIWGEEKLPFSLTPEYSPDLPESLANLKDKPFSPPTPY